VAGVTVATEQAVGRFWTTEKNHGWRSQAAGMGAGESAGEQAVEQWTGEVR
jgi:hypothetical protein